MDTEQAMTFAPVQDLGVELAQRAQEVALVHGTVTDLLRHAVRLAFHDHAVIEEATDVCAARYAATWKPSWRRAGNILRALRYTAPFR